MKVKLVSALGVLSLFAQTLVLPALADDAKLFPSLNVPEVKTIGTTTESTTSANTPVPAAAGASTSTVSTTSTTSSTSTTSTTSATAGTSTTPSVATSADVSSLRPQQKIEQTVQRSVDITQTNSEPMVRVRIDKRLARKMAKDHWLEKAVAADPSLIDAITQYSSAAKILAKHPRIGRIAEADHYTCRRITRWKTASRDLARNPEVKQVIDCDPEGMSRAIKRDSKIGKLLVKQPDFSQIIVDNPELGKLLATHM